MSTYLKEKIHTAASAFAPLTAVLGTNPFRMWDTQLKEGSDFPAIVVRIVSNPRDYAFQNPLPTSWARVQFTIWARPDSAAADDVAQRLFAFFQQFNAIGISGLKYYPNLVVLDREDLEPKLEPPVFTRIIDAKMFNNDLVN